VLPAPATLFPAPAAGLPVPAAVLPGPAPGGDEPYTLDTGDRLRVVVFGQDGLSNTYIIDASGRITIPLIGSVSARGCTTGQLARVIADRLRNGYVRDG
jgi:polysaccharide biosynthesis/export protein